MKTKEEFKKWGYQLIDFIADYSENVEEYPVKSQVAAGEIKALFASEAPEHPVHMEESMKEIREKIMPGITHWQHPRFHAYFPANNSFPSILGELLSAGLGVQAMIWETSPAAAELEEVTLTWLRKMMDLPENWEGVIQDTASTATLVALLTAREKASAYSINENGFKDQVFRVYCSEHAHSSIDKAVKISGIGSSNIVKIPCDEELAMNVDELEKALKEDQSKGYTPLFVMSALGTTSTVAIDPIEDIAKVCDDYGIWNHVDAAYAGNAMVLPEFRESLGSFDKVDSFVFNPHKWMMTNFDLSVYYVKDKEALINTFSILPEYLRTESYGKVNDYRDWGVQLGRRFRALKMWLVLQNFGQEGIRSFLREHMRLAELFENYVIEEEGFELIVPRSLNVVVFRYVNVPDPDEFNRELMEKINARGKMYLTHTKINGNYCIRMVIGNTRVEQKHVEASWKEILETTKELL